LAGEKSKLGSYCIWRDTAAGEDSLGFQPYVEAAGTTTPGITGQREFEPLPLVGLNANNAEVSKTVAVFTKPYFVFVSCFAFCVFFLLLSILSLQLYFMYISQI